MKNSKLFKGALAGGLGLALLLGGGTFALWYQSDSVDAGAIQSGQLNFSVDKDHAAWTAVGNDVTGKTPSTNGKAIDVSTFRMVPGDTVTYSSTITVNAVGDDLKASLTVGLDGIVQGATGDDELVHAIESSTKSTVTVDYAGTTHTSAINEPVTVTITPSARPISIPVTVTVHFPADKNGTDAPNADRTNWWGTTAQNDTIELNKLTFDLTQQLGSHN